MLKILKNLKESLISVIIIVILLCLQAGTDLALPDYTSKIVNIGIQQGGIQNVSPEAIRKEQMENLLLFSTDDEKILNCYTLISKKEMEDKEYEKYLKQYPELENQDIYVLNNLKKEQKEDTASVGVDNAIAQIVSNEEENVEDDLELIAVITAAIAASEGTSTDGLVVRSIRKVNNRRK